jgi:hypothetical protein
VKGRGAAIGDVLAAVFLLALVMLLVRPNSLAPSFLKEFGAGMTAMIEFAVTG